MNSNDLIILFSLIKHTHHADGLGAEERKGNDWLLHENKNIKRVVIFTISLRNKAIVVRVDDRRVEDTVDVEETSDLVEFVFDFRATRDFNDCRERERGRGKSERRGEWARDEKMEVQRKEEMG